MTIRVYVFELKRQPNRQIHVQTDKLTIFFSTIMERTLKAVHIDYFKVLHLETVF